METGDEAMGTSNNSGSSANSEYCSHPVVKGKRTKRQRVIQLSGGPTVAAASSASSSSGDFSDSNTEEDEDMANCLILLAQGRTQPCTGPKLEEGSGEDGGGERFTSRRLAEATTTTNGKAGFYVYECKTCNKCFPSFQALGGHRSSHKKPKNSLAPTAATEEKAVEEDGPQFSANASNPAVLSEKAPTTAISVAATAALTGFGVSNPGKSKVHECSICGSEFSSGQALGGHMRRHRPVVPMETQEAKKMKSILSLDLNLPAPADDDRGDYPKSPSFPFVGGQSLIFSPSALVDCHY